MGGLPLPWRWLVWVTGAALLATVLWWAARGVGDPVPSAATRINATTPQPVELASSATVFGTLPSRVAERPQVDDEVQVCGLGWVKAQADGSVDPNVLEQGSRASDARAGIVAALRADKNELSQAVALWLSMIDAGADIAQIRDALAKAVVSSTDPQAYALAFNVCRGNPRNEGACQMLSASQWARLDPGNATPWLTLLSEAKARKDRAAEDEALYRIGSSQRSDLGFFAAPALAVNAASGDDLSVLAAWSIAVEMIGSAAAWSIPSYQHVVLACKGAALNDTNRRQTCSAIADVLTDYSNSFVDQMMGVAIGKQLGRPAARREWQSDEYAAYLASLGRQSLACADLRRGLDDLRRKASVGEAGALREWVAQSGKRPEDFAREARFRQTQQALELARSQAASAPEDAASAPRPASAAAPP
ncbi:MAG: hypothetical protein ABI433_02185 [Burkholderiaceae bacterium]